MEKIYNAGADIAVRHPRTMETLKFVTGGPLHAETPERPTIDVGDAVRAQGYPAGTGGEDIDGGIPQQHPWHE